MCISDRKAARGYIDGRGDGSTGAPLAAGASLSRDIDRLPTLLGAIAGAVE